MRSLQYSDSQCIIDCSSMLWFWMMIFYVSRKSVTFVSLKWDASANLKTETDIYRIDCWTIVKDVEMKEVKNVLVNEFFWETDILLMMRFCCVYKTNWIRTEIRNCCCCKKIYWQNKMFWQNDNDCVWYKNEFWTVFVYFWSEYV